MNRYMLLAAAAVVVIVAALGAFLGSPPLAADNAMHLPVDAAPLLAETATGERSFTIEIADDPSERSAGLMFRETMADDRGMLFVFPQTKQVGFWMKNTPMPLDLVFIGEDGVVRDVLPGEPFSEAPISPAEPVRYVLELKRGTAEKAGIGRGTTLRHPAIGAAQ